MLLLLLCSGFPLSPASADQPVAPTAPVPATPVISVSTVTAPPLASASTATAPVMSPGEEPSGQGAIIKGQTLTVEQCVEIALRNNPNMIAAANTVDVNKSRVGQARAGYYPQVSASAGYSKSSPIPGTATDTTVSLLGRRYDQYTGSVTLNQNFLDFKTSPSVDAAKYSRDSSRFDLATEQNTTVLTVKQAYYGVLQAKRNRDVAADVIRQFQLHLDQAKGFYDVGTRAKIDVIKAEVDLSNAKLSLINAENNLKIAWVNLNNAMGVPDAAEYAIEDDLSFQPYGITLEDATARALKNRPDLRSIIARRQAAESNVSVARSGYFPVLSGSASYNRASIDRERPSDLDDGWQIGVTLTLPLFNGFLTSHQIAEAKSTLYVLRANEEAVRQQILLDVRQAYFNLQAAEASIATAELAARQARENLDLANGRYAAGVGSPVEVSDAFATYVTAQANYTSSLSNYKIAQADIERAVGAR
jgi:outer membrane protein TolC